MLKFEEAIACIRREINFLRTQNKRLLEENKELKSEHYKDEELSKMKDRLDNMYKEYCQGFPITDKEEREIRKWKNRHFSRNSTFTYEFIPTEIGIVGTVKCSCGDEFVFRKL